MSEMPIAAETLPAYELVMKSLEAHLKEGANTIAQKKKQLLQVEDFAEAAQKSLGQVTIVNVEEIVTKVDRVYQAAFALERSPSFNIEGEGPLCSQQASTLHDKSLKRKSALRKKALKTVA